MFNTEGTNSIVLMAVVGADCKFIAVDIGAYGSNSDGGIWKDSAIGIAMEKGTLNVPGRRNIPRTNIINEHVLVGDEAFQLQPNFMWPFPRQALNRTRRIFNYRLSRARFVSLLQYDNRYNLTFMYSETCQNRTLSETETWFKRKIQNFRSLGGSFHDKKPVSTGTCETRTESGIYSPSNLLIWTSTLWEPEWKYSWFKYFWIDWYKF